MRTNEEMRNRIMRRVWGVYFLRMFTSPAIRLGVLLASGLILVGQVSVPNVIQNAYNVSDIGGLITFSFSAFFDTNSLVQFAVLALFVVILVSIYDVVRRMSNPDHVLA